MGVWIEIGMTVLLKVLKNVTPFMGVWIEILCGGVLWLRIMSHPLWVCGLKSPLKILQYCHHSCHTLYGCVDWNGRKVAVNFNNVCHTLYGCVDWNSQISVMFLSLSPSHPLWVCGLKYFHHLWIMIPEACHTLYGCVDWNKARSVWPAARCCHTLYGCVDWNLQSALLLAKSLRHTLYGCVDWNQIRKINQSVKCTVTPFMGVWIEMSRRWPCRPVRIRHTLYGCVDWKRFILISIDVFVYAMR